MEYVILLVLAGTVTFLLAGVVFSVLGLMLEGVTAGRRLLVKVPRYRTVVATLARTACRSASVTGFVM
jgi:hypothetical protein